MTKTQHGVPVRMAARNNSSPKNPKPHTLGQLVLPRIWRNWNPGTVWWKCEMAHLPWNTVQGFLPRRKQTYHATQPSHSWLDIHKNWKQRYEGLLAHPRSLQGSSPDSRGRSTHMSTHGGMEKERLASTYPGTLVHPRREGHSGLSAKWNEQVTDNDPVIPLVRGI